MEDEREERRVDTLEHHHTTVANEAGGEWKAARCTALAVRFDDRTNSVETQKKRVVNAVDWK